MSLDKNLIESAIHW